MEIPNLLEYYPIDKPGEYTVQLNLNLETHDNYVGRAQTQIADREITIREINTSSNYSATEKAGIIQGLRDEIEQLKKSKSKRYLVVGSKGKLIRIGSNILKLTVQ